jgi:hypothetical protein
VTVIAGGGVVKSCGEAPLTRRHPTGWPRALRFWGRGGSPAAPATGAAQSMAGAQALAVGARVIAPQQIRIRPESGQNRGAVKSVSCS